MEAPVLGAVVRARRPRRLPVVLSREEVRALLAQLDGTAWLVAALLYGSGLRLLECLTLRVKKLDFASRAIRVRDGKGRRDRVMPLPGRVEAQLERTRTICTRRICEPDSARSCSRTRSGGRSRTLRGSGVGGGCFRRTPEIAERASAMRSGAASRPTCSPPATTSAPCRSCSATQDLRVEHDGAHARPRRARRAEPARSPLKRAALCRPVGRGGTTVARRSGGSQIEPLAEAPRDRKGRG